MIKCGNEIYRELKRKNIEDKILYKKYNSYGIKKKIIFLEEKIYLNIKRIVNFIKRYV